MWVLESGLVAFEVNPRSEQTNSAFPDGKFSSLLCCLPAAAIMWEGGRVGGGGCLFPTRRLEHVVLTDRIMQRERRGKPTTKLSLWFVLASFANNFISSEIDIPFFPIDVLSKTGTGIYGIFNRKFDSASSGLQNLFMVKKFSCAY